MKKSKTAGAGKTYEVEYSLKFSNSMEIEARTQREARKKFLAILDTGVELDAVGGGTDGGYKIESVRPAMKGRL
jgi:hypothetical protein